MSQLLEWLTMGKYSLYVWSAYGVVSVVFLMHFLGIRWQSKQARKVLLQWFKRQS